MNHSVPIISIKEARKLLGVRAKNLTNDELERLINDSETLVRALIRNFLSSKK